MDKGRADFLSTTYRAYQKQGEEVSAKMKEMGHPCLTTNKSNCCEYKSPVMKEDILNLLNAVTTGLISRDTLEQAKIRSQEPENQALDRCSFLTSENDCSIYAARPLMCMVYGDGFVGVISNRFTTQEQAKLERDLKQNGSIQVKYNQTTQRTCQPCYNELASTRPPLKLTMKDMQKSYELAQYMGRERFPNITTANLAEVVLGRLGKEK